MCFFCICVRCNACKFIYLVTHVVLFVCFFPFVVAIILCYLLLTFDVNCEFVFLLIYFFTCSYIGGTKDQRWKVSSAVMSQCCRIRCWHQRLTCLKKGYNLYLKVYEITFLWFRAFRLYDSRAEWFEQYLKMVLLGTSL